MASITKMLLFQGEGVLVTPTTEKKSMGGKDKNFVGFIKASNYVDGTFTGKIQHSPNGIDWFDLVTFTALTANGSEIKPVNNTTVHVMTYVKAVLAVTGSPADGADVEISLHYNQ